MKKILILTAVFFNVLISFAQEISFEKLEDLSRKISKSQLEVDGKTYNNDNQDIQISFPEENFTVAFHSQLATNVIYRKSNDVELLYLTENISLARVTGITTEIINNNIILYTLHFGKFTVTTKVFKDGELVDTTYKNNLILYSKYNGDETNYVLYKAILEINSLLQISLGLTTKEKLDIENKDWLNLTKEDFVKKYPNAVRTMAVKNEMTKKKGQTTLFMDDIAKSFNIKIGMTEEEFSKKNSEIAKELFKKKNVYVSDGGNYRAYSSYKKVPQVSSLVFKYNKLSNAHFYRFFNNPSDRLNFFYDYKNFAKANFSSKDYEIDEDVDKYYIYIKHPNDNWALTIYYNKPAIDKFSRGIPISYFFITNKKDVK